MNFKLIATFMASILLPNFAMAHGNATGKVKERMEMMEQMAESIKSLKPIFTGKKDYQSDEVSKYAKTFSDNSGKQLVELFEKGSNTKPSEAKDEIWENWNDFVKEAEYLNRLGQALVISSKANADINTGRMGHGMIDDNHKENMMGDDGMMGMSGSDSMMFNMSVEQLANMPPQGLFFMIQDSCSSCHTKYREKDKHK